MNKKLMTGFVLISISTLVVLFIVFSKYTNGMEVFNKKDMAQQKYQNNYQNEILRVFEKQLSGTIKKPIIMEEIEKVLARATFSKAISKGRIGRINDNFLVGNLIGNNKLIVNSEQSPYFANPAKLTIGEPYSEQAVLLNNTQIYYLNELESLDGLSGASLVIFTRTHIYYLDLTTSKGRYFIRLETS
ncbi:MAG: hypothetical protein V3V50_03075 [Gammaproteobacteria bacterium]